MTAGTSGEPIHEVTVDFDFPMVVESTFKRLNRTSSREPRELDIERPWYRDYANRLAQQGIVLRYVLKPIYWGSPPKEGVTTYEHLDRHCASCPHCLMCQLYGENMAVTTCRGCVPGIKWLHHRKKGNPFVLALRNPECPCRCTGFIACPTCLARDAYPVLLNRLSTTEPFLDGNMVWVESTVVLQAMLRSDQMKSDIVGKYLAIKDSNHDFVLRGWDSVGKVHIARKSVDTKVNT